MLKQKFSLSVAVLVAVFMTACGSYMNPPAQPVSSTSSAKSVVNIGDAPGDNILAFEITINSIVLTDSAGKQTSVLSAPARIELTRLAGTFAPLSHVTIPPGTYVSAAISVSNPEIVFLNSSGAQVKLEPALTNASVNVAFSPSLAVGAAATSFNFDFDVSKFVNFDAAGVPSVTPTITVVPSANAGAGQIEAERGDVDEMKGIVSSTSSNSFTMTLRDGTQSLTFNTDSSTQFKDINGVGDLKAGMQVEVSATMQSDGSLLAREVEAEVELEGHEAEGASLEGLVTSTTGSPVTQLSIVVRDTESSMSSAPQLGSTVNAQVTSNTKFGVNSSNITLTSLGFTPTFDSSTLSKGQNVEIEATMSSGVASAAKIRLSQQALRGNASAISTNSGVTTFTLTLPADSAFAMLTGISTVQVYRTSSTELKDISSITDGASLRVRGLLFFDGTTYRFVARSIGKP